MTILFDIGGSRGGALITIAGAVFIAPYFLLSAYGGELADRFERRLLRAGLSSPRSASPCSRWWASGLHSIPALFGALLGFGVIGALFGPLKYGILPDLLDRSRLPMANALVEGATFLPFCLARSWAGWPRAMAAIPGASPA